MQELSSWKHMWMPLQLSQTYVLATGECQKNSAVQMGKMELATYGVTWSNADLMGKDVHGAW